MSHGCCVTCQCKLFLYIAKLCREAEMREFFVQIPEDFVVKAHWELLGDNLLFTIILKVISVVILNIVE